MARRRRFTEHRVRHRVTKLELYCRATAKDRQVVPERRGMANLWMATDGIGLKSLTVQAIEKADELAPDIGAALELTAASSEDRNHKDVQVGACLFYRQDSHASALSLQSYSVRPSDASECRDQNTEN